MLLPELYVALGKKNFFIVADTCEFRLNFAFAFSLSHIAASFEDGRACEVGKWMDLNA